MLFKKKKTWLLIADGARASIYQKKPSGKGLARVWQSEEPKGRVPTREQGSDRPGRGFGPVSGTGPGGRHAFSDPADWHQQAKDNFAKEVAGQINRAAERRAFDEIVIAAPPKTLGELRAGISDTARSLLRAELAKDLTNVSVHNLPRHFEGIIKF